MKETLKIMGMESWVYSMGFLVMRGIWMTIPTLLVVLFIWLFNTTDLGDGTLVYLFLLLWIFGAAMLTFTLFVQNFFSSPDLVSMVLPFLFFIPVGLAMTIVLGPILTRETNDWTQYLFFYPTFPFMVIMVDLLDQSPLEMFSVSAATSWVCLILQIPFFFFLHLYTEAVIPNNFGISKHPFFCCQRNRIKQDADAAILANETEMIDMKNEANVKGPDGEKKDILF